MALRSLSLCSGVGMLDVGISLAEPDHRTFCYCEIDHFAASVLVARMQDETLAPAPVWDDVGTFDGRPWRGVVDLVTAGFPCQPVSLAGKRLGMADERFIWDDIARIIGEVRPRWVLLENVPGILTSDGGRFLDRVFGSLVELGFDLEWDLFSAEETGAPHRRLRWFCLAHANSRGGGSSRTGDDQARPIHAPLGNGVHVASPRHGLVQEPGRGPHGRDGAGPAGAVLGHADRAGREEHGGTVAVRPQQPPAERAVGPVGHAASGARLGTAPGHGGHAAQPDQGELALTDREHDDGGRHIGPGRWSEPTDGSVYPPARNDRSGWAELIADDPSLEPAVRGDADGLAAGLDPALFGYRNQRLRAVGNGVVPLTAATAWIELRRRLEDGR